VEDKPYKGKRPTLPRERFVVNSMGIPVPLTLQPLTLEWWTTVTTLPHCALWTPGDWTFAVTTALVADAAHTGVASAWAELRRREDQMGVTAEARRKLRIRYVPAGGNKAAPATGNAKPAKGSGSVTNINDRRARLTNMT
jgi:hypothetical protein